MLPSNLADALYRYVVKGDPNVEHNGEGKAAFNTLFNLHYHH